MLAEMNQWEAFTKLKLIVAKIEKEAMQREEEKLFVFFFSLGLLCAELFLMQSFWCFFLILVCNYRCEELLLFSSVSGRSLIPEHQRSVVDHCGQSTCRAGLECCSN